MASRDLHNNIKIAPSINPAAGIIGNGATNGAAIDTQGYESVEFAFISGVITDGTFACKLQHGDAANLSDAADVDAADLVGSAPSFATTDDGVVKKLGYKGNKRYVRQVATQAGATTGGFLSGVAILGNARNNPVA